MFCRRLWCKGGMNKNTVFMIGDDSKARVSRIAGLALPVEYSGVKNVH